MDTVSYKFEMFNGWPPDGEPGDFFGFDADMAPSLLRWREGHWCGVQLAHNKARGWIPEAFVRGKDTEHRVLKWARAPGRYSALGA